MIVDVNVNLSHWPFRRTPCDELAPLLARLGKHGVTQAWVGNIEGLLHRDIEGVNRRLADVCRQQRSPELVPFGTVNPTLPDWREDLRRCHEVYRMPGIRLHPNYHNYQLDNPLFAELLDTAGQRNLIVQLVVRMDDERVQHPLMKVPNVNLKPLPALLKARPKLPVVILNGQAAAKGALLTQLAGAGRVYFDIATQELVAGVAGMVQAISAERVLFGSHLPLFALESAVLKIREAALDPKQQSLVEYENATRLLAEVRHS
jgi:predicted TIM-barrel fold metal-dependent hydrolase